MTSGNFYFLNDKYFEDFPDDFLMKNKEFVNGESHDRPCFYSFQDEDTGIYWMIPFSSKVQKYKKLYRDKIKKYGFCDTILFGNILGHTKAFLIQNMCPVTEKYINNEYIDKQSGASVRLNGDFEKILIKKSKKVLSLVRNGVQLVFPDILYIEKQLLAETER